MKTFQLIPDALLKDTQLNPQDIKVYGALRSHLGKNQYAFPSIALLAKETGVSKSTVDRCLKNLCQQGHIQRQRNGNGQSARTYLRTLVRGAKVTIGKPLVATIKPRQRPKRRILDEQEIKRILDEQEMARFIDSEEMELYYINERKEQLDATNQEYLFDECRHVIRDVPDTSPVTHADTSPVTH